MNAGAPIIDFSCRLPLLVLFLSGAVWLLIGSAFDIISSIKFHSPNFLAGTAWLTYGRLRPAFINSLLYGFCVQAGLGVALWLLVRLGQASLPERWLVTMGAAFWNLGLTIGVLGVLSGDATGFEGFEMPPYAVAIMFLGYLIIAVRSVVAFHRRRQRPLFVSQWFLLAAVFWFPWIFSTAILLLLAFPPRGVAQSVISWWYSANLQTVWIWLVGLATVFYLVPKLCGRALHSRYLALFTFWTLILFGSWTGVPNSAPVPAWIPALSTAATPLTGLVLVAVLLGFHRTAGRFVPGKQADISLWFVSFGVGAFVIAGLMRILGALPSVSEIIGLTWFSPAQSLLNLYGFFCMVMFGAIYYILPRLLGLSIPSPGRVRAHFWLALAGIILIVAPYAGAGIAEGFALGNASRSFQSISQMTLNFLRVSTLGDLLLAIGHVLFFWNLIELVDAFYRARAVSAYKLATADLFHPAEVKA